MKLIIGTRPDRQQIHALMRCKLPESEALIGMLKQRLEETKSSLVIAEEQIRIYRLQGRAEILAALLEAIEKSPELLDRVTK